MEDINKHLDDTKLLNIYKNIIISLIEWINNYNMSDCSNLKNDFAKEFNRLYRKNSVVVKKSILNNVLRRMIASNEIDNVDNINKINLLKNLLQKKPSRNISGITSVTLLTSPHPNGQSFSCKHDCFYCPNEPAHAGNNFQDQPRSYLYNEPAVRRANENNFLAVDQMLSRLNTLYMNGHEIDKLEIILEGGTYTEYPPEYLEEFHRDIFYVANTYFINDKKTGIEREKLSIAEEMKINETARVHIIGICIETRPDAIDDIWIRRFRMWGVTRIQIGIQHTDNPILKKINRGHTIEQALDCMQYLKDNCFKIDIHVMPDLPYTTPEMDKQMFDYVYSKVFPDQMKIYPCEVTPWTMIEKWYKSGKYKPYSEINMRDLIDVIKYGMEICPRYIRLPRVIRDIPISYIQAGNPHSNLRQMIDIELEKENKSCKDLRSREIGRHVKYYNEPANYNIIKFEANGGMEYFIAYESWDKEAVFGFIRLRLPFNNHNPVFPVLKNKALIRELHVYGTTNSVGQYNTNPSIVQHKGIGSQLLKLAEKIAIQNYYRGIVVISGEGVKDYYRKRRYTDCETYMVKIFNIGDILRNLNMLYKCVFVYLIFLIILFYISYKLHKLCNH